MLYQTHHHPFFFQFHSFSSIPLSATATTSLLSSSILEMEGVELALKSSIRKEMASKSSPHAVSDDTWAVNGQNGVSCDDFFVDDLLDFSNNDGFVEQEVHEEEEEEEEVHKAPISCASVSPTKLEEENFSNHSSNFDYGSLHTSELSVPTDDVADLEWLSHFVEDSFSECFVPFPAGPLPEKPKSDSEDRHEPEKQATPCFKTPVPAKARSKRTRTGGRVWSLVGSPSLTESSSSSTSSSSSSSPTSSSPWLVYATPGSVMCSSLTTERVEPVEQVSQEKPPVKKQKKKQATDSSGGGGAQPQRRCSHCGVTKTPQWRAGPLGAKTLCNACGVRYKSGRLLPEYRPACSPTFSSDLHSNHHRKVLEMRRKKEVLGQPEPGLTLPVVPSF